MPGRHHSNPLQERRASPRFKMQVFIDEGDGGLHECYGVLGIRGVYFETTQAFFVDRLLDVVFILYGLSDEVRAKARVTRVQVQKSHVGVVAVFEDLPFATERKMARFLDLLHQATQAA